MLHEGGEGIDWSKDIDNMEILAAKVNALKPKPSFIFCTGKSHMIHIYESYYDVIHIWPYKTDHTYVRVFTFGIHTGCIHTGP